MSSTGVGLAAEPQDLGTIEMKLEVVTVPVADAERSKRFYQSLGWRLDADLSFGDSRVVQVTPLHSPCSIHLAQRVIPVAPGSAQRMALIVSDLEAAREDLMARGVDVGEPYHRGASGMEPGVDPDHQSYNTYAEFRDPDGNGWLLQEVTARLPGREWAD
jgi:catechol 2,3-dioxygenase-like lactoylglutathione lyase family enzyme